MPSCTGLPRKADTRTVFVAWLGLRIHLICSPIIRQACPRLHDFFQVPRFCSPLHPSTHHPHPFPQTTVFCRPSFFKSKRASSRPWFREGVAWRLPCACTGLPASRPAPRSSGGRPRCGEEADAWEEWHAAPCRQRPWPLHPRPQEVSRVGQGRERSGGRGGGERAFSHEREKALLLTPNP